MMNNSMEKIIFQQKEQHKILRALLEVAEDEHRANLLYIQGNALGHSAIEDESLEGKDVVCRICGILNKSSDLIASFGESIERLAKYNEL